MHDKFSLAGKTALITGATRGIGKATTLMFQSLGARVLAVARTAAALEELREEAKDGEEIEICAGDVSTTEGRCSVIEHVERCFGESLDCLVNNVGTNVRKGVDDYPLEDLRKLMAINTESAFELSKGLKSKLTAARGASIVNVSSVSSLNVVGTSTVGYAMTKGALDNLTRWLAVAWAPDAIRVNGVHPWYTLTELTAKLYERTELVSAVEAVTPLDRWAKPEEIGAAIAFLCMPAAGYITGVQLPVDGGYMAHGIAPV